MTGRRNRLVYAANARLPTEKAHGYQIMQMCQAFAENGMSVTLRHPARKTISVDPVAYYNLRRPVDSTPVFCIDLVGKITGEGVFSRFLKVVAHQLQSVTFFIAFLSGVYRDFRKGDRYIIYTRDWRLALILCATSATRRETVWECHALASPGLRMRLLAWMARRVRVVSITGAMKDRLAALGVPDDQILVEPDAVDPGTFGDDIGKMKARRKLGLREDEKIALYVGRFHTLEQEKGIPQIISAAGILAREYPDLVFTFVGGPMESVRGYHRQIDEEGTPRSRFRFVDRLPVSEVPVWLASADMLLMTHPWTEYYAYYLSPLKLFEYMMSRRPIVASDLPSFREILADGETALLAEPDNPDSIARAVKSLIDDDDLGMTLAQNAHRAVQEYTWQKRAGRIAAFIVRG